ncbi:hypothetical protein N7510_011563 [Penicillium lagena]|uniref:uncharacterized protein n=1 Tax=Penicillium lagena TaxID=94218 RepID=UPI0025420ECF|nr:uncharacterized protein N7510_011563 [Penicillium lagena]KAJ5602029.1 hypothetical protein N7510_011563 [Penicillium lagena]
MIAGEAGTLADPVAKGIWATAKQSWCDLFRWKQRAVLTNEEGEIHCEWQSPAPLRNPFALASTLSAKGWLYFMVGLAAWMADAVDFNGLSIQTVKLSEYYNTSYTNVTTAITLTLLLRSVGALFFGLAGDRFGRKWPMVINLLVLGVLQIATTYAKTFGAFLGVRALFGLFMGGIYGNATAMALENCPTEARGLMSGILQQGYSMGYVVAASVNLGIGGSKDSWKIMFWVGAGFSFLVALVRILFPESRQFTEAKKARNNKPISARAFWAETKTMLSKEWRMWIYCIILMAWFNSYVHTSQDSYITFLLTEKELPNNSAARASILALTGACVGGTIMGYISQFFGRRRSIIVSVLMSCCMIPAWILPNKWTSLSATGFFLQFWAQAAFGVIPIHLNELAPPQFRSSFPGLTYQLGNMISSPSTQIVNAISSSIKVKSKTGKPVDAYGPTMAVATAVIALLIALTTALGPERRGAHFETAKVAGQAVDEPSKEIDDMESQRDSIKDDGIRSLKMIDNIKSDNHV